MTTENASPAPGSAPADDRARQIVDFVLDYTAKAGRIVGRRPNRMVEFGVLLNMKTGESREVFDDLVAQVEQLMDGTATYRPHVEVPSAAGPSGAR